MKYHRLENSSIMFQLATATSSPMAGQKQLARHETGDEKRSQPLYKSCGLFIQEFLRSPDGEA